MSDTDESLGSFLTYFVERYDREAKIPKLLENLATQVAGLTQVVSDQSKQIKELRMAYEEKIKELGVSVDANTEITNKVFAEVRDALDEAKKTQITQADVDAAVTAAKAAQKSDDDAAVEAALAPLSEKVAANKAAMSKVDDLIPDKPVVTETPETPGTPTESPTVPPTV